MRGSRYPDDFWENQRPLISMMRSAGASYAKIADCIGTAPDTISNACKKMGIDKLSNGQKSAPLTEKQSRKKPLTFFEIRRVDQLISEGWISIYAIEEVTGHEAVGRIF
ncbi:helix-turn-helix domain-containing protein [Gluconobacter sphaericus]|uniref:helix-turn-helix domain-containing protein n=1 Tax=Gluconobacter sphaericus TaxID=574987 RepID=UPI0019238EEC|nr:helix-turn-helix domain-containing protein [Gluconobacter sphaericus]QQX91307.1 helix-turn-helix domain-containing protein [Gluconobacter sphaericus]